MIQKPEIEIQQSKITETEIQQLKIPENDVLFLSKQEFKKDYDELCQLYDYIFAREFTSKGTSAKAVLDDYLTMAPFLKFLGIFKKRFRNVMNGFVYKNTNDDIIATVNVGNSGNYWEISMVATHPKYRRRGLGEKLVTTAIEFGKDHGANICVLEVIENNTPAYNLYLKLGFIHYETIDKFRLDEQYLSNEIREVAMPDNFEIKEMKRNKRTNKERIDLLKRTTSVKEQATLPIDENQFDKGLLVKILRPLLIKLLKIKASSWLVYDGDLLIGEMACVLSHNEKSTHNIIIEIDPKYERELAKHLISKAIRYIQENKKHDLKVIINVRSSYQDVISVLNEYNFKKFETDHMMGLKL